MIGITKIGQNLDFKVMSNPFGIKWLNEKEAKTLVSDFGLKFKTKKLMGEVSEIIPLGNENTIDSLLNFAIENKIATMNRGIAVK